MSTLTYRGLELDGFQRQAIEHLQAGQSVLVAAPTGTGKTLVADWIVEEAMKQNKSVIYTAPIKALSNQNQSLEVPKFGPSISVGSTDQTFVPRQTHFLNIAIVGV